VSGSEWSRAEVEAIVDDYFDMLLSQLTHQRFNKTTHRSALRAKLNDRSDQSVEYKHSNISAVLLDANFPYITGYKKRSNYQALLADVVMQRLHEGFDVLSFETNGAERLIEVKTTKYGIETPFYVTRNEVAVSERQAQRYQVYRLFSFRDAPRLYTLPGAIGATCQITAANFVAMPK
jgi:hypothetical protein